MPRYLTVLFDLGVAKQKLDSPDIAGAPVHQGSLRASERMRSEKSWVQPNVSIGVEIACRMTAEGVKSPMIQPRSNNMKQHILKEFSTRLIDWSPFVIMGNTMPPRDPNEDEEDEEDEDEDEEDRGDEPAVVREPDDN